MAHVQLLHPLKNTSCARCGRRFWPWATQTHTARNLSLKPNVSVSLQPSGAVRPKIQQRQEPIPCRISLRLLSFHPQAYLFTNHTSQDLPVLYSASRFQLFHTSPRHNIPPILWLFLKPIAKVGAIITGRQTRKWWQGLSEEQKLAYQRKIRRRWYILALAGVGLVGSGVWYYQSHLEDTPITGRRRFVAFNQKQFMAIVEAEAKMLFDTNKDKIVDTQHPAYARVSRVALQLVSGNRDLIAMDAQQWKIAVLDDPQINAFVLPTGHIFVPIGLLDYVENDDQLGVVLGHEMAHAILSHGIDQVSFAHWIDFCIIIMVGAIWLFLPTDGIAVLTQWLNDKIIALCLHLPYNRLLEKEADRVGLELAAKACFDVREGAVFWERMHLDEKLNIRQSSIPEWISTHPSHENRVEFINYLIPKVLEVRENCQCPRLPPVDPRNRTRLTAKLVDAHLLALKSGQNLKQLTTYNKK